MQAKMWNKQAWVAHTDASFILAEYNKLLTDAGFTVIKCVSHSFDPYGFTAMWLLGESHFAVHTFPEQGKSYIELSSCVSKPFKKFIQLGLEQGLVPIF